MDPQVERFQFDQRVTAHYFQARILWLQGFADQAVRVVESNLQEAWSVGNALSVGSVLGQGACPIALFTGDLVAAQRHGAMLLDHAGRHSLGLWRAWARAFNAVVRSGWETSAMVCDCCVRSWRTQVRPRCCRATCS